jgi:hypothetical protein
MEYLEESLRERMNREPVGKIAPGIALDIVKGIMGALDYAHLQGIYHRDIKPENIMFRKDNTPVLLDFGIAKIFDEHITKTGTIMGTTYYMSPEQCISGEIDGRTDIYSLGVVLFEMLTGKKPYEGDSGISLALKHIEGPVPKLPQELNKYQPLIDKMMAKDKKERIFSRPEFSKLLERITTISMITSKSKNILKKIKTITKSLFQKCLKLLNVKLVPFLRNMREELNSSLQKKFRILNPRMNKPIVKKVVLVYFPAVVILAAILIVIFSQGNQSSTDQSTQQEITLPIFGEVFKQAPKYYEKLSHVHKLYAKGDLKSLNDAKGLINELKKTAIIPEIEQLEEKITKRLNLLNLVVKKYYDTALEFYIKKDFPKAMEYISKAKENQPTDKDILELEKLIEQAIEEQKPKKKEKIKSVEN